MSEGCISSKKRYPQLLLSVYRVTARHLYRYVVDGASVRGSLAKCRVLQSCKGLIGCTVGCLVCERFNKLQGTNSMYSKMFSK